MLTRVRPSPSHASQRPPLALSEKSFLARPAARAAGVSANRARSAFEDARQGGGHPAPRAGAPEIAGRRHQPYEAGGKFHAPVRPVAGRHARGQHRGHGGGDHVEHERGLAAARHARDGDQAAGGNVHVETTEVVAARLPDADARHEHARASLADRPGAVAQVAPGGRRLHAPDRLGRTGRHHLPALLTRARPKIHDVVGRANDVRVVLDHEDGVSGIAKPPHQREEPCGVARVKASRRLVEHVGDPRQAAAHLRRQSHALRLARREAGCLPAEREIAHARFLQPRQPALDLLRAGRG